MANILDFASQAGSDIVTGLTFTSAEYETTIVSGKLVYGKVKYQASGSPDLSGVLALSHRLTVSGFENASNNGENMVILEVNDTDKTIFARVFERLNNSENETGASATGSVTTTGSEVKEMSIAKNAQGMVAGEKVGAATFNWIIKGLILVVQNALAVYQTLSLWKAAKRIANKAELVRGLGWVFFDYGSTETPGEGVYADDDNDGRGYIESLHPDAMAAMLAAFVPEMLPPVKSTLVFSSGVATVTVPGAQVNDAVAIGPHATFAGQATARVSAADTVTIQTSGGSPDGVWSVVVTRPNSMPVITLRGLKIYANLIGGAYADSSALETDLGIADNEVAFNLLVNSKQHRAALLDGDTIEALVSGSATADAIITATGGY